MADRSDFIESLRRLIGGEMDTVNTAIPCTVVSYNNGRVTVKPVGEKVYADGDSNAYPVLTDLRMQWPQFAGGQAGVKGPVQPGDECLLICCQQAIDNSGDTRKFDLIDSYVIPGCGYMDEVPGNDDMRLYYSNCFLALSADGKATLNAPGGFEVTAPMSKFNGEVTVENMFTYQGGMTGNGGSGSVADITGTVNVTGDVVINGIRIGSHKHPGDSGGTTGGPQN
ncbi:Gp138 family membrane-puncturing spike protein [Serratia proteamaculans]|uniref:Baseplate assembly protein n=1 Tax=Serratia proteamaculans TaxID=28151 RepID=A0A5Q2VIU5_SERPR|nr:Gp138 family membrane-puncturing spike protein [Serratia proteamaculans]QGH63441.1 baseplate assembly protein [Serratia proteamaculans]